MVPPKVLKIHTTSVVAQANWPSDSTQYAGRTYRWTVTFSVTPQPHSSNTTQTDFFYNGLDVEVGDWFSNLLGGRAWKIVSISAQTALEVTCIAEDEDQYNTYNDPDSNGEGGPSNLSDGFLFQLSAAVLPILVPVQPNVLPYTWATDIISRFFINFAPSSPTLPTVSVSDAVITEDDTGGPEVSFDVQSITFDDTDVDADSEEETVVITNTGDAPLIIDDIDTTGDFSIVSIDTP